MPFPTSRSIQFEVHIATHSTHRFPQVLQARSNVYRRITTGRSLDQQPQPVLISQNDALLPISLHHDEIVSQFSIELFLSTLDIDASACQIVSEEIASNINEITSENREPIFHILAVVNTNEIVWALPNNFRSVAAVDGYSPARIKVKMEILEEKIGEDLGVCSICLNEFNFKEREVVKIPCGHVYDESCILKWLGKDHSCPLCRRPVPLELEDQNDNNCGIEE